MSAIRDLGRRGSAQLCRKTLEPDTPAAHLHRYVYRQPPPWPAYRGATGSGAAKKAVSSEALRWAKLDTRQLPLQPLEVPQIATVPELAHGLEHVKRAGGLHAVHALRDRSQGGGARMQRTSKATKYLRTIIPPERILWERMPKYIPAKQDTRALALAATFPKVCYSTSTSSVTPALTQLYHLLSNFRDTDLVGGLSMRLSELPGSFARFQRRPIAFELTPSDQRDQLFSLSAHEGVQRGPTVLLELGNSIERMLTTSPDDFMDNFVRRGAPDAADAVADAAATPRDRGKDALGPSGDGEQFYHFSVAGSLLMRAQIDCRDGDADVFDVKTRAVAPIRYNLVDYRAHEAHRLRALRGVSDSYEREFYDMVRSVFIKYALQLRIGRMAGALIAYHNTSELLGFEYVALREIEAYVFGSPAWADTAFATSVRLLELVLSRVREALLEDGQKDPVKVVLATERTRRRMIIYAQRVPKDGSDKLGPQVFADLDADVQRSMEPSVDPLHSMDFWHADAELHSTSFPGVAVVGASPHVAREGGEKVDCHEPAHRPRRRGIPNNPVHDAANHDMSGLSPPDFYAWTLDVAPLVGGLMAPKGAINVENARDYELRYRLEQIKDVSDFVKAGYVSDLARLYTC